METVVALFGVQPLRIGGVETFTRELALALAAHGWRLVAIFGGPPKGRVAEYLSLPNLRIEVVPELEFSTLRSLPPVMRIIKRYRPRVFHFQFVNFIGPYPWLAKLLSVERVFFTAQGSNPIDYTPSRASWWKRVAVRTINFPLRRVFCISEYVRQTLTKLDLLPAERFRRIYNAIVIPSVDSTTCGGHEFRARFGIPAEKKLVVQVSWMIPEKGIPDVLEAARVVLAENPQTHFVLAGNGDPLEDYRAMAHDMGIGSSVTFTGLMESPMEEGIYAAADIFCLASRWQEAFGWVLAEAMSFRKPVVATRVGAIPEIVRDGETGVLVAPQNPPELAAAILSLLNQPSRCRGMGETARHDVEQRFDLHHMVQELVGEYGIQKGPETAGDKLEKRTSPRKAHVF